MKNLSCLSRAARGLPVLILPLALALKLPAQPSGYALDFRPASNSYVKVTLTVPPATNYSLTAWVNLRAGGTLSGTRMAVLSGTNCSSSVELMIRPQTETTTDPQFLELGRCGVFNGQPSTIPVTLNAWTHVAVTVSSNQVINYYVNGIAAGSWTNASLDFSLGTTVLWGANNGFRAFDGLLDNAQIWNRVLTPAEVLSNRTQTLTGIESGLLGWYPFNEGAGNTTTNAATNTVASAGTLVNNPLWVSSPAFTNTPIAGLPGLYYSSVAWGDYDNDGRLDFLVTGATNLSSTTTSQLWRNNGDGTFSNVTATAFPAGLPGVYLGSVAWGDYDNDGRLDFLLTGTTNGSFGGGLSQLWRNTGSGFSNVTATAFPAGLPGVGFSSVAWGDYDNDGRLDVLISGQSPSGAVSQLWQNTGSGFTNATASAAPGLPSVGVGSVAWGDYDNDGRLDFLLTGTTNAGADGALAQLWRNTGGGFTNVPIPGLPGVDLSSVAWGDYDHDGRLDFLLTGYNGGFISQLWRNTGGGFTNAPIPGLPAVAQCSVAWGDYDNDGRLDFLLTGSTDGSGSGVLSQLWHNTTPVANAPPSAPTGLALTAASNGVTLSWNPATDDYTPDPGLTYNVRAGTTPGGIDLLAGQVDGTGFRRVPAMGNAMLRHSLLLAGLTNGQTLYWSVQAVDTSFAGGPFATESSYYSAIVTTTADSGAGSLRFAATTPVTSKLITFDPSLSGQTITLTGGQITLSNTVTIDASALPGGVSISGNTSSRVFNVTGNSSVALDSLTIRDGAPAANGQSGGGIQSQGSLTLTRCTLFNNSVTGQGGGLAVIAGAATLNECTLSANAAGAYGLTGQTGGRGGAIYNPGGSLALNQCTLSGNSADNFGGGLYQSGGSLTALNSIIAGNTQGSGGDLTNTSGTVTFSGANLTNGSPLLAPLGNYGGPTPTMPPLPGSPAIDGCTGGTSFTTDQRGLPRIVGAFADIGAVENAPPTATNLSAAETYTEDTPLNLTDIVVSDLDSTSVTATLTLSTPSAGSLTTGTSGTVTSTYNSGTGVWTASGAIANVNVLLAGVSFVPTLNFNGNSTIATSVSDGIAAPVTGTKNVTGTAVNDPPTATNLSAAENYTEDTALNLVDIVVSDVDNTTTAVTLTLSIPSAGSLTTGTSGAVTSTYNAGTGVWTASGAIANVNTLLANVSFVPAPNFNGNFTIATSVSDGIAAPVTGTKNVTGTAVNDAPTASNLSAAEIYAEDTPLNLVDIVVSDVDNTTTTVTLTLSNPGAGALSTGTSGAVTSTYNSGTGTWTASGAIASVNSLLAGVTFTPATHFNSNFTIATSVSDGVAPPVTGNKTMTALLVVTIPGSPTNSAYTSNSTPSLSFSTSGGVAPVATQCRVDTGAWAPGTSPFTTPTLAEGLHLLSVLATDSASHVASNSFAFTVDTTPPMVVILTGPNSRSTNRTPSFTFYTNDASPANTYCRLGTNAFVPSASPFTAPAALDEGAHSFEVYAIDAAGNVGATSSYTFYIDLTGPTVAIPVPPNLTNTADNTPTFVFTSEPGAAFFCGIDGGAFVSGSSPFTILDPLADGPHTFAVYAVDLVGNVGQTNSFAFTVDTTAPPTLTNVAWISGAFRFTVQGAAGRNYAVEGTTDFSQWTSLVTNAGPAFDYTNSPSSQPQRFFRTRSVP